MSSINEDEFEDNEDKIDWSELIPKSPKYYEVNPLQFLLIIIILISGVFIIRAAILGLWDGGTQ